MKDKLSEIFTNEMFFKHRTCTPGIDQISIKSFMKNHKKDFEDVERKINNRTFSFTRYKALYLTKGYDKPPRVISVPTVRDRVILKYVNKIIGAEKKQVNPQMVIKELTQKLKEKEYTYFISYDIEKFYNCIDHGILKGKLKNEELSEEIIYLIDKAIQNKTVDFTINEKKKQVLDLRGIPQGIPISNRLSDIYMKDIDKKYTNINYIYNRYVDDILIIFKKKPCFFFSRILIHRLKKHKLRINKSKIQKGYLSKVSINYLGFTYFNNKWSVKDSNVKKVEKRLEKLFLEYYRYVKRNDNMHKYLSILKWKINLMIRGAVFNGKNYGWLYYYSSITEYKSLFHLDYLLKKLLNERFKIDKDIYVKKFHKYMLGEIPSFVEVFFSIKKGIKDSMMLNLDEWSTNLKRDFLKNVVFKEEIKDTDPDTHIERVFAQVVYATINDIEKDYTY